MFSNFLKVNSKALGHIRTFASKSGEVKLNFKKADTYLCDGPAHSTVTNKDELMTFFTEMTRFRRLETVCDGLYKKKLIRGFCHLYTGQVSILKSYIKIKSIYKCFLNHHYHKPPSSITFHSITIHTTKNYNETHE
ncbi:hypothetical protein ACTFIV_006589 [Dictyostelium citrinum]